MPIHLPSYIAGQPVDSADRLQVLNPWDGTLAGSVARIGPPQLEQAIQAALAFSASAPPARHQRAQVLEQTAAHLREHAEEFATLITQESGLCLRETRYEVGRACDVFRFAAMEALRDDGQVFSCDITPGGKARKIFTTRDPLRLVAAITPFNHPLNQVAHKLAPAIAAGAPIILKPSEKTPLTATRLAEVLYQCGLPGPALSLIHGGLEEITRPLVRDERVDLVTFTGSAAVGRDIAATAGYKKLCLELGGHSPMIVLDDADPALAARLACEGAFRNSGQRCTSARRLLVQESILPEFTARFVELARTYTCGNPMDEATVVGTVIDEAAARSLESAIQETVAAGARLLLGGTRQGARLAPTILADVPRTAPFAVRECFGPIAPIFPVKDLDDALHMANASPYGLSSSVVTNDLQRALRAIKELRVGTVNINEIPGYRLELSPFGGIKDSGLGIKEGVIEAIKFMTTVKTFSLPW